MQQRLFVQQSYFLYQCLQCKLYAFFCNCVRTQWQSFSSVKCNTEKVFACMQFFTFWRSIMQAHAEKRTLLFLFWWSYVMRCRRKMLFYVSMNKLLSFAFSLKNYQKYMWIWIIHLFPMFSIKIYHKIGNNIGKVVYFTIFNLIFVKNTK